MSARRRAAVAAAVAVGALLQIALVAVVLTFLLNRAPAQPAYCSRPADPTPTLASGGTDWNAVFRYNCH